MKAFTDISQSKKLAKILPKESADMVYIATDDDEIGNTLYTAEFKSEFIIDEDDEDIINCWSLTALLSVYPMVVGRDMDMYCCWQNSKNLHSRHYDNPIDACVEMIVKLKEKGLI